MTDHTPEQEYDDFWKDLVEVDGVVNMDLVKNELSDYSFLMKEVPKVYMEVTNNTLSKPNYFAHEVINLYRQDLEKNYMHKEYDFEEVGGLERVMQCVNEFAGVPSVEGWMEKIKFLFENQECLCCPAAKCNRCEALALFPDTKEPKS